MDRGVPDGEAVVLDVSQLQTLLRKSFNIGIDPDPRKPRALNRLELAKALQGAAEANALAAKGIAIERGVESEQIAGSEALALHAAAYNGMPDPVFHLVERAIGIVSGLVLGDAFVRHASDAASGSCLSPVVRSRRSRVI